MQDWGVAPLLKHSYAFSQGLATLALSLLLAKYLHVLDKPCPL